MSSRNFPQRHPITPPISVVTTGSSSTSSNNSNRREQKIVTPTILLKAPSSSNLTSLHTQQQQQQLQQQHLQQINTVKDDKEIDSALLSALRDQRERMALLRLEKHIIDFMNDKECQYMDVGGAFNNILIKGTNEVPNSNNSTSYNSSAGSTVENYNLDSNNNVMDNNGVGRKGSQTSFQRLCLHRLADRFNIVRQTLIHNNNNSMHPHMNMYHYPTTGGGGNMGVKGHNLIRLIKVNESRIPTLKLIDVDLDDYEGNNLHSSSIPQDRGLDSNEIDGDDGTAAGIGVNVVKGITDRITGIQLDNNNSITAAANNVTGKKSKKKEKVKIMKRSPNNSGSKNVNKNTDADKNKRKGKKNLSDKTKAYEEARARIFQESSSCLDGSDHASNSAVNTTNNSENNNNNTDADSSTPALESTMSADGSGSTPDRLSPFSQQLNTSTDNFAVESEDANVPAAAKGGAESKVLWRNRQQEASDPDFRRAHHPIMVQQPVYHQQHPAMMAGHGAYNYQDPMDAMGYGNRHSQHGYYDASWQMHQMQNGVQYNPYTQNPYEGISNNDIDERRNSNNLKEQQQQQQQQQPPAYTEEEFPALG